jgi:hypothetical protein
LWSWSGQSFWRVRMHARSWMAVLVALGCGLLPLLAGEESPHESAVKEMLKSLDKLTITLASVKDAETAEAARPELKKAAENWVEVKTKAGKLAPPDKAEKDRLAKEYKGKMDEAIKKFFTEYGRVRGFPAGRAVLMEIKAVVIMP